MGGKGRMRGRGGRAGKWGSEGMGGEKRREAARERQENERTDTWLNREMDRGKLPLE